MPAFSFLLHFLSEEIKIKLNLGMKWGDFLEKSKKRFSGIAMLVEFRCGIDGLRCGRQRQRFFRTGNSFFHSVTSVGNNERNRCGNQ